MDLLFLEVDGSLRNPYAAGAMAIWTVILSVVLSLLARSMSRSGRTAGKTAFFVGATLLTNPAQFIIGNLLYRVTDPSIGSVGFWGGPPIWTAPAVGCLAAIATWVWSGGRAMASTRPNAPPPADAGR